MKLRSVFTEMILVAMFLFGVFSIMGCTTAKQTGDQKFLGVVNVTKLLGVNPKTPPDPAIGQMIEQLSPFVFASLILIIGGAILWKATAGSTGLGITLFITGWALAIFAVVMPQIAGWLGLIAIMCTLILLLYLGWKLYLKLKASKQVETLSSPE